MSAATVGPRCEADTKKSSNAGTAKGQGEKCAGRVSRDLSWRQKDAKYLKRARSLFELIKTLDEFYNDSEELEAMNRNKRGAPYRYTDSFIAVISRVRDALQIDYRTCEAMADVFTSGRGPEYTTIFRRINARRASIMASLSDVACKDTTIDLVPDGTGLTPATRSEYVRVVHKLRRGFLRLTIMISKETLEIVSFTLTDDSVGATAAFKDLVEDALRNMGIDPEERRRMVREQKHLKCKTYVTIKLMADGGYDSRKVFSICRELGIETSIRIRKNANCRADGVDRARTETALDQLGGGGDVTPAGLAAMGEDEREANRKEWKRRAGYGTRWLVEIVISAFKRTYGGDVMAKKLEYIRQEIRNKICTHNAILRIGWEGARNA